MAYKKNIYDTVDGLILTGEKVIPEAYKKPTLMPGFFNNKPRFATYFNITDTNNDRDAQRKESLFLIMDINATIVMFRMMKKLWASDEESEWSHTVRGPKFIPGPDGRDMLVPGELEVKGMIGFGTDSRKLRYVYIENAVGIKAYFFFKQPVRSVFKNVKGDESVDISISRELALGWAEEYLLKVSTQMSYALIDKRK